MAVRIAVLDVVGQVSHWKLASWLRRASVAVRRWRWSDRPDRALTVLSPGQKALLRQFLEADTTTLRAPALPGVALGLEHAEIIAIYREPAPVPGASEYVLCINTWAREQLRRHPELLGTQATREQAPPAVDGRQVTSPARRAS